MKSKLRWSVLIGITVGVGIILSAVFYLKTIHYIYGQTCFTPQTAASDSRCLYILQGKVYEKGTRSKPHQGNSCGTDVTSIIPSFHFSDLAKYLDPNYVGNICTVQPTPTPTVPIPTPTLQPSPTNQPTSVPICITKSTGDADCNGVYDFVDFEIWRKEKMKELFTKSADFNSDFVVDMIDFEIWRKSAIH